MNLSSAIAQWMLELVETENERRLRVQNEANKELDDCEADWQDRKEAARQPFARKIWIEND